ncbi:cellulose binding domain-containing protein [Spirillospora albida]|uniref:cellulose binding domain-containing protein n=1 Tax=Spirillospora albida TaxID=58123 RepID=UPI00068B36E9|nr:cellulose binding domain-containing protein [Spirillospora albida]
MGRHTRLEPPDDDPLPDARRVPGRAFPGTPEPSYEAFSGPADDQVVLSPYDPRASREPYEQGPSARTRPGSAPRDPSRPGSAPRDPSRVASGAPDPSRVPPPRDPSRVVPAPPAPAPPAGSARRVARLVSALPVPLLPLVSLVVAVGVVSYTFSTQQISLNFAGGPPRDPARDGQVSQRGPGGDARPDGIVVAFRVASRSASGFKGTVTIANRGERPVARWALAFAIDGVRVREVAGATVQRRGAVPFLRSRPGATLAPGGSVRIVYTATGAPRRPGSCVLNGLACTFA